MARRPKHRRDERTEEDIRRWENEGGAPRAARMQGAGARHRTGRGPTLCRLLCCLLPASGHGRHRHRKARARP